MKNLFKKIFGSTGKSKSQLKERPKDWNLTISDLMNELNNGKRKQLNEPELTWAREYERSLIPSSYRFPRKGDLYQSKQDQEIEFLTAWSAPYTGGGKAILLKGEKIWIDSDPMEKNQLEHTHLLWTTKNLNLEWCQVVNETLGSIMASSCQLIQQS